VHSKFRKFVSDIKISSAKPPDPLTRGFAPKPHWGQSPQTPAIYRLALRPWGLHNFIFSSVIPVITMLSYSYWPVLHVNERSTPGNIELSENINVIMYQKFLFHMYIPAENLRLSRISAEYCSAENEPKIMWLAGFSAEFLHQSTAVCKKIRLTCLGNSRMCVM
jgi:hypothetical protein